MSIISFHVSMKKNVAIAVEDAGEHLSCVNTGRTGPKGGTHRRYQRRIRVVRYRTSLGLLLREGIGYSGSLPHLPGEALMSIIRIETTRRVDSIQCSRSPGENRLSIY
jgi:hypothetical protein